jgi:hypothetical protein
MINNKNLQVEAEQKNQQFKYRFRDIEDYIKEYIGNFNAVEYNESEDIQTLKKEHNNEPVIVFDTFTTNQELEALASAIYFLGEKIGNTMSDDWCDNEKEEHEETIKHLCRLYGRYSNNNGRKL